MALGLLANPARFLGPVPDSDDLDQGAVAGIGPQALAKTTFIMRDEAVGGAEDVAGRAVILFEANGRGAGEILFEAQDIGNLRTAPRVDRLVVVADAAQVVARMSEELEPFVLRRVGVLIFVDQNVAEAIAILGEDFGLGAEDHQHVQQQIAEVAGVEGFEPRLIRGVELGPAAGGEGFGFAGVDLVGSPAAVLPAVDEAGKLARWPAFLVEVGGDDQLLHHPQLIVGVEDREIAVQPDQLGMGAEHLGGDRMERAEPRHSFQRAARQLGHAIAHFPRRLVGEGDAEDLARPRQAAGDEVGEARGQRRGLAGAGAGEDQHRAFGRQHGLALRRIEAGEVGGFGRNGWGLGHWVRGSDGRRFGQPRPVPRCSRTYAPYPRYPQAWG